MTFGFGLGAGLKALAAARLGIQTAGHNVANANTPGFSRQRVLLSSALPFTGANGLQIGTGVDLSSISRLVDNSLITRLNAQIGVVSGARLDFQRLGEIEGIFGEPDAGLSQDIASLFGSIGELQTDPADRALRGGVVQNASTLTDSFNLLSSRLTQIAGDTTQEITGLVRDINSKAERIAALNGQIGSIEANGTIANDLRDQRDLLARELSEFADVRTLERDSGSVDILIGGHLYVSGDRSSPLSVREGDNRRPEVVAANAAISIRSGRIGSLLRQTDDTRNELLAQLDQLARNLALEFNRTHTTGVPGSGPFQSLTASIHVNDNDGDGQRGDELLGDAGLPFDIERGQLYVNVTDRSTGDIERTRLEIDPATMTLEDLANSLSGIDKLQASVDPAGRLRIQADSGYGFDFSPQLDRTPNTLGTFGGERATIGSAGAGPFDLSGATFPQTFGVDVDGTVETVTLNAADFANPSSATASELAAAIQDDLTNATARDIGGRLVIRSNASGGASTLALLDGAGAPLAALGAPAGPATGSANGGVQVEVGGDYTGSENGQLTFVPDGDGEIGVTPGLTVGVFDASGSRIGTLNVGESYEGKELEVGDGISVSFSQGEISASNNEVFALDTLADSDNSDVLVALGLNSFFVGHTAETITVNQALLDNPDLLAGGLDGAAGDGGNLARFGELRDTALSVFGDVTIESFYGSVINELGFEVAAAGDTAEAEGSLLLSLENQREQVSGVNIDEELVDLVRHQQAFEAAARFINTVQELTSTLINLGA